MKRTPVVDNKTFGLAILISFIFAMIFIAIIVGLASFTSYKDKTKDYKTPEQWALDEAKNYFLYYRDSDDIYVYEIKELSIGNFNNYYGEYFKIFYVKMIDDSFNSEEYLVSITYNLDKSFWANFSRGVGGNKELIGLEHIVWVDIDEI